MTLQSKAEHFTGLALSLDNFRALESVLGDQRRLSMVAQTAFAEVFMDWIAGLEKDLELTWNRDPRPSR